MGTTFSSDLSQFIVRLNRSRRRYLGEHLREYSLTVPMHAVLMGVWRHPGSSQEFLADHFFIDKATVARCAGRLEKMSYLSRDVSAKDRRLYCLYLTPTGEDLTRIIQNHSDAWSRQLTAGFSDEERKTVLSLLSRMDESSNALI